jgi:gamma-glutamyltranspeptidase/glutathione hydrolase
MVVSANHLASQVGADVLAAGGNAVDAAIATGFALAVTHPTAGNIGGGGFMVVRRPDGEVTAFDFREKAPLASYPEMFLDRDGEYSSQIHHNSHMAVGVPGTVAGFALAHQRLGSAAWADLVRPSVDLARYGFELSEGLAGSLERVLPRMEPYPASVEAFSRGGTPYAPGENLVQGDLANTLERIQNQGRDGFYLGETAELLAREMGRSGGLITEEDLARYEAVERTPVQGTFRGYDIISMPPPSSGGVALVEMLNILEGYDLRSLGHNSPETIHLMVEAMRRAYRDRAFYLGDPDFVSVPVERLTDKSYAALLRRDILTDRASTSEVSDIALPEESPETTHYSVVDASGMAVSVTYTLEAGYGSKIVVPGAGFLLNNEMGDFNPRSGLTTDRGLIGTDANLVRPEKRMLSRMTPSIVARDGDLVAVVGSPGGRTIINTVLQVILNITEFGMDAQAAVDAARLHHQWLPDNVRIEDGGVSETGAEQLRAMGHEVRVIGSQGRAHSIVVDPVTGERVGAADRRDPDGGASGHWNR